MEGLNFEQFLKEAKADAKPPLPEPIEYTAFEFAPVEKPKPIIENLLDASSRMIFGGGSKTFKTWAMSDLAISIVTGVPWWGFDTHQCAVLYVNFELKDYYCKKRFHAIRRAKEVEVARDAFHIWNLRGYDVPLGEFKLKLVELIKKYHVVVVFIDPFYRLLGTSDERISAELMPVLMMFEEVNRLTGASVICAAHFTKGNQAAKDPLDRISGGASLNRHPDCLLTLTKHDQENAFTIDLVARDFPPLEPFVVKWSHPLLVQDGALDPKNIKRPERGRPQFYTEDQIINALAEHDDQFKSTKALQAIVTDETGMGRSRFYELWSILKTRKVVFRSRLSGNWNLRSSPVQ